MPIRSHNQGSQWSVPILGIETAYTTLTFKQKLDRVEYQPTEKGLAVQPILDMMALYSMKYCSKDVFKDTKPGEFQEVYGREMARFPPMPEIS